MKLTPDLLSNSISRINALKDRELALRGKTISASLAMDLPILQQNDRSRKMGRREMKENKYLESTTILIISTLQPTRAHYKLALISAAQYQISANNKISAIENLGVTKDLNDAIDFTNNDIRQLGNFPRMLRLKSLLLANNRIGRIDSQLVDYIPNLTTLILTNNLIQELGDLEPLTKCRKLEYLSLLDNPVTKKKYYRLYIIHKIPSIRVLDFKRVRKTEREEAKETFKTEAGEENELAVSIGETKSKTFEVGDGLQDGTDHRKSNVPGLSPEEQAKIKEALKNATSLEEMQRLENLLKSGQVPGDKRKGGAAADAMEEDEE